MCYPTFWGSMSVKGCWVVVPGVFFHIIRISLEMLFVIKPAMDAGNYSGLHLILMCQLLEYKSKGRRCNLDVCCFATDVFLIWLLLCSFLFWFFVVVFVVHGGNRKVLPLLIYYSLSNLTNIWNSKGEIAAVLLLGILFAGYNPTVKNLWRNTMSSTSHL